MTCVSNHQRSRKSAQQLCLRIVAVARITSTVSPHQQVFATLFQQVNGSPYRTHTRCLGNKANKTNGEMLLDSYTLVNGAQILLNISDKAFPNIFLVTKRYDSCLCPSYASFVFSNTSLALSNHVPVNLDSASESSKLVV